MATGFPDWQRAFTMMGTDGEDFIPVLLGPDGSMYAVLQGEYAGSLRTVKLDDEGRISAFVVDSADAWGQMLTVGNAELAARLGSLVRLDRRGSVIHLSDFGQGWGIWETLGSGAGNSQVLDPTRCLTGGYSVALTAGSTVAHYARVRGRLAVLPDDTFGVAVSFSRGFVLGKLEVQVYYYDGTNEHLAIVQWDETADVLKVQDEDSNWVTVATSVDAYLSDYLFNYMKVTVDVATNKYKRLMFDNLDLDLSAHSFVSAANADNLHLHIAITNYGRSGFNDVMYLDSVVVTTREPD